MDTPINCAYYIAFCRNCEKKIYCMDARITERNISDVHYSCTVYILLYTFFVDCLWLERGCILCRQIRLPIEYRSDTNTHYMAIYNMNIIVWLGKGWSVVACPFWAPVILYPMLALITRLVDTWCWSDKYTMNILYKCVCINTLPKDTSVIGSSLRTSEWTCCYGTPVYPFYITLSYFSRVLQDLRHCGVWGLGLTAGCKSRDLRY